jgi:hypothetical protein
MDALGECKHYFNTNVSNQVLCFAPRLEKVRSSAMAFRLSACKKVTAKYCLTDRNISVGIFAAPLVENLLAQ